MSPALVSPLLAGLAVWLLLAPLSTARARELYEDRTRRRPELRAVVTVLTPIACLLVLGPWLGLLVAAALTPVARGVIGGMQTAAQRRRDELLLRQLPGGLDLVVAALDAGRPPVAALGLVADIVDDPLATELRVVTARLQAGGEPQAVWTLLAEHRVLGPLGRAFGRAETSGMPVAGVVGAVADEMRRARRSAARERSRRVGVRTAAPLGACFLPAFFLVGVVPTVIGVVSGLDVF
ncbi:type II secretion system F family protein [Aeromicrobium sp. CTD01-1L150]|uniref:type II secretion system F family protein n=1 Tax=Aeromicrobium sp. CTD01-1L150 TaxID=3341830 RepID=UPI0035BF39EA